MNTAPINAVVVVGRDAALWLAAGAVQVALQAAGVKVTAIELPSLLHAHDVYATLPALEALHHRLGLEEAALLSATAGAFSLGQNFVDASGATPPFFHAHGAYGAPIDGKAFFPYWLKARGLGLPVALEDFSLTAAAAKHGRMLIPDAASSAYGRTDYGYHLPAVPYVALLKKLALQRGVTAHRANHCEAVLDAATGTIAGVRMGEDRLVAGQLFIDATGVAGQLIGTALGVGRESWREYFPADRAMVACAARFAEVPPYAEIRACSEGWLGLYPSQACTHVVQVYAAENCSDDEALRVAVKIAGRNLSAAVVAPCEPGRRASAWARNCVAVGDAACSFDPVHGVDLHALQFGLVHLLTLFPAGGDYGAERTEYNRTVQSAFERLRDFQSAHYGVNRYASSGFWNRAREVTMAAELRHKLATFRARGEVPLYGHETFAVDSWQALLVGHGVAPETYDPVIDRTPPGLIRQEFIRILAFIKDQVQAQASHGCYLQSLCPVPARD